MLNGILLVFFLNLVDLIEIVKNESVQLLNTLGS